MYVTLHRYVDTPAPGDLTDADLLALWRIMKDEGLVEVFFHDGHIRSFAAFRAYAAAPGTWLYAAVNDGVFIGLGVVNNFSSSGNTAYAHLCSFKAGRVAGEPPAGPFAEAGRQWFELLRARGGLKSVLAVLPACYRGARRWTESFGFTERLRLPGALRLARESGQAGGRITDAVLYVKDLSA